MDFSSFMLGAMLEGGSSGGGGGGGIVPPHLNVYIFSPIISAQRGVDIISGESVDNAGNFSFVEKSAGYEGINFELSGLTSGTSYIVNFNFQFTTASFMSGYRTGYNIFATNISDYSGYPNWTENLDRDLLIHNHRVTFTATAATMYLSFNVCGLSDSGENYFNITDFYVEAGS